MSRYDKYDPISGGFRADLAADWPSGDLNKIVPVGLNASGQVVKGAGNTGVKGVVCLTKLRYAGEVVDVMTDGEIVEAPALAAGTNYYGSAAGAVTTTNTDVYLGSTVEATRLVVRMARK